MEEAPEAYKDVTSVVDTCHDAGISNKVVKLRPVAVIKGKELLDDFAVRIALSCGVIHGVSGRPSRRRGVRRCRRRTFWLSVKN